MGDRRAGGSGIGHAVSLVARLQSSVSGLDPGSVMDVPSALSVPSVFSRGRDFYVYLQAYQQSAAVAKPLVAFVSFYQGQTKVFETQPMAVTPASISRLGTAPLSFSIGLNQLPTGEYDFQVTILDPTEKKRTFWQAQIMVVP